MYRKIWDAHVVYEAAGEPSLIYIDRHLVHEGTSPQAIAGLKETAAKCGGPTGVRLMDHFCPTKNRNLRSWIRTRRDNFRRWNAIAASSA